MMSQDAILLGPTGPELYVVVEVTSVNEPSRVLSGPSPKVST